MYQPDIIGKLISVQVAEPTAIGSGEDAWTTGFFKQPVVGSVAVTETHLVGDGQADQKNHGGRDKAILGYSTDHRDFWEHELKEEVLGGGFGENLSISGVNESNSCIGDRWMFRDVVLEITQPRQPCWKLGRRWNRKDLPKLVVQNGRSGWYFRVIKTGDIEAGIEVCLLTRPHPQWSVKRASQVFYGTEPLAKRDLAQLPELSDAWKQELLP